MPDNTNVAASPEDHAGPAFGVNIENRPHNTKTTVSAHHSVASSGGVLATATDRTGGTLIREPQEGDIVTVAGVQMPLKVAEAKGFVEKDARGRYVDISQDQMSEAAASAEAQERETQEAEERERAEHGIVVSDDTVDGLTDLSDSLRGIGANPAAIVGSLLSDPDKTPDAVKELARRSGVDEAAAWGHVKKMGADVEMGVSSYLLTKAGLGRDQLSDFFKWARGYKMSALVAATNDVAFRGTARGFGKLAREYMTARGYGHGDISPDRVKPAGLTAGAAAGTETVPVRGGGFRSRTSVEAARRLQVRRLQIG